MIYPMRGSPNTRDRSIKACPIPSATGRPMGHTPMGTLTKVNTATASEQVRENYGKIQRVPEAKGPLKGSGRTIDPGRASARA